MKKMMSLLAVLVLCVSLACSAMAAEFVPSITYKDGPELNTAFLGEPEKLDENVSGCIVVTSIIGAREKKTDIRQENRDLLLEIYEELSKGEMTLPVEDGWVIRDLVDVSNLVTDCIEVVTHDHEDHLKEDGIVLSVVFDLGIAPDKEVKVLSYYEGEWEDAVKVTNNGDGTITCLLDHSGPVAFCVEANEVQQPTAPTAEFNWYWLLILIVALIAVIEMVLKRRKLTGE